MQSAQLRRRQLTTLLGSAAAAWPLAAHAQQSGRMRQIGVLMGYGEADPEAKTLLSQFTHGLSELGWSDGRNVWIDIRWATGNVERMQTLAKELVDLRPDVILANTTPVAAALQWVTQTIPIVASLGREPRGSLVVMNDGFMFVHRAQIIVAADKSHVPTIYYDTIFARDGGLLAYGTDRGDIFRRDAPYVDHLLRGAKPTELPVQLPAKFEMAFNAKAAKTLGLIVPESLMAIADEVIE